MGTITASVSHELNNVISIIDQTSGLLEDMLVGSDSEIRIPAEKLDRIVSSLHNQTVRGHQIIKNLNTFAHSADKAEQKFDMGEPLLNLIQLIGRLAGSKGVKIETRLSEVPLILNGSPFFLKQAVFEFIRLALTWAKKGDIINVGTSRAKEAIEVIVEVPAGGEDVVTAQSSHLKSMLGTMSGSVQIDQQQDRTIIRFVFPGSEPTA